MNCITKIPAGIAGGILTLWARTKRPHRLALEKLGIRIVALTDYRSSDDIEDHDRVYAALMLLHLGDPGKFRRVKKHIKIIFLHPISGLPQYLPVGRICHINLATLGPQQPERAVAVAGVLVYFATLAELRAKAPFCSECRRIKMQALSKRVQERVVHKISKLDIETFMTRSSPEL